MKRRGQPNPTTTCASILSVFVLVFALATSSVFAQQQHNTPPKDQDEGFSVVPIPIVQPVTQEGGGLALAYKYHTGTQNQKNSSSSMTAVGGFLTSNRSWGVGIAQKLFFKEDAWRVRMAGSYADIRYNYYGIGTAAGESNISVLMQQKGFGVIGEAMYRFDGLWYGGALYRYINSDSSFRPNPQFNLAFINPRDLDLRTGALGPRVMRDSRSDTDYPRSGSLFDARVGFNDPALASDVAYQTYDISYSKYISTASNQVLAVRGAGCYVSGDVPFFDLCLLSASENLRGYRASRYRDRSMVASQAEYRWEAWRRLGFVAFGGAGVMGPKPSDFIWDNVLPGGGAGVRYRFTRESHVNVRFDYSWGKSSHQAYFFIGEAF
jgi:hypothetical protein